MNGRSFMDGLSLEEKERERKRGKKEEERGRERERERKREEGLEWELNPPAPPDGKIHQGSDEFGRTGDQDEWDVIHLDGRE